MAAAVVERIMTITQAEFIRSLGPLERHYTVDLTGFPPQIEVIGEGGRVRITLAENTERRVAHLKLPSTRVRFEIEGFGADGLARFWRRFDLSYRRGGG